MNRISCWEIVVVRTSVSIVLQLDAVWIPISPFWQPVFTLCRFSLPIRRIQTPAAAAAAAAGMGALWEEPRPTGPSDPGDWWVLFFLPLFACYQVTQKSWLGNHFFNLVSNYETNGSGSQPVATQVHRVRARLYCKTSQHDSHLLSWSRYLFLLPPSNASSICLHYSAIG